MSDRDDRNWEALGEAIRARRRALGIHTQTAAADRSGIDINTWNKAELGRPVGSRALKAITQLLDWDPGTPHALLMRERTSPLVVIPLTTSMGVSAAILRALADAWRDEHGQTLTAGEMPTESTPWGPAIVVRAPQAPDSEDAT